jgi:heme-degrading monooxygenase HmoA
MFVILWEYEVKTALEESFENMYGPHGSWVELFRSSPHYLSTQLLRDPFRSSVYFTLDFWHSEIAYQQFKLAYYADYDLLDHATSGFFVHERCIGSFLQISTDSTTDATATS